MFSLTFHDSTNLNGIPFSINGARNTFKKFDGFNDFQNFQIFLKSIVNRSILKTEHVVRFATIEEVNRMRFMSTGFIDKCL